MRLVNGSTVESGRLEVCSNNIWGSVCGNGFSVTDAYVICRQLGLGESGTVVILLSSLLQLYLHRAYRLY